MFFFFNEGEWRPQNEGLHRALGILVMEYFHSKFRTSFDKKFSARKLSMLLAIFQALSCCSPHCTAVNNMMQLIQSLANIVIMFKEMLSFSNYVQVLHNVCSALLQNICKLLQTNIKCQAKENKEKLVSVEIKS